MIKKLRPLMAPFAVSAVLTVGVAPAAQTRLHSGVNLMARAAADTATDATENASGEIAVPSNEDTGSDVIRSSAGDECLQRSEMHFNSGRQLYFQGDLAGARREFDEAVDILLKAPESLPDHGRIERRLQEICDLIYRFDVEKLGAGKKGDDDQVAYDKAPIDAISDMTFGVDEKLAPKLQSELTQTTSEIPLELAGPVPGLIRYFTATENGRRVLQAGMQRAGRYRPLIQRILAEEGVPQELIYLAQAESGFLPRAVSNKRAVGMWQFIADTGATYHLVRTVTYDERLDPEKATRAAARFLKHLHERYGDWYLAMAAYNCGAGAVDRAIERTGYADYWELLKRHTLPRETANYVPIILALTIVGKNPQDYGLDGVPTDSPLEYDTLRLTAPTHLELVADATLQPLSVIRDLNPSIISRVAPAGFQVHVPKGTARAAEEALESVPANNRHAWRLHHVSSGDTIAAIAKSYHLAPERIAAVNGSSDSIEAGDTLLIPASDPVIAKPHVKGRRYSSSRWARTGRPVKTERGARVVASRRISALHRKRG